MRIFDRFKKSKQNIDDRNNEFKIFAQKMSITAIDYAKDFNKEFDYSKNSIADLEEILDYYSNDISKSKPTEKQIWSMSMIFGSYLGETMLKNGLLEKGYFWGKDNSSDIPLLIRDDGGYLTPNDKVYKRLVNGNADNVVSFYKVAMEELWWKTNSDLTDTFNNACKDTLWLFDGYRVCFLEFAPNQKSRLKQNPENRDGFWG